MGEVSRMAYFPVFRLYDLQVFPVDLIVGLDRIFGVALERKQERTLTLGYSIPKPTECSFKDPEGPLVNKRDEFYFAVPEILLALNFEFPFTIFIMNWSLVFGVFPYFLTSASVRRDVHCNDCDWIDFKLISLHVRLRLGPTAARATGFILAHVSSLENLR